MILSGRDLKWYIETGKLKINGVEDAQFQQNGVDLILDSIEGNPEELYAGGFYLGSLRERISMPDDLMAFVELRSTWARSGIIIPPTIVDAGFEGDLILELAAFKDIKTPYKQRFAHLIFARLTSPSVPYKGKYQGQKGITQAIFDEGEQLNLHFLEEK